MNEKVSRMQYLRPGKPRILAALLASSLALSGCGREDAPEEHDGSRDPVSAPATATDSSGAAPAPGAAEPREVISENMPYAEIEDTLVYGYFVAPSDMFEPLPAIIMIHEWWGLNDEMRARAERLAAQGYIVLAIDLFGGKTTASVAEARVLMLEVAENPEAANENIRSAFEFVSRIGAPTVATVGWRFGGTWSLNAAMLLPDDLDATVIYYAQVTDDEDKLRPITAPVLGLFAEDDISVKTASIEAFQNTLRRLRKEHKVQFYAGVRQGFASESGANYDAASAEHAWNLTLDFLRAHLVAGSASEGI